MKAIHIAPAVLGILVIGCSGSSTNSEGSGGSSAADVGGTSSTGTSTVSTGGARATGGSVGAGGNLPGTGGAPTATGGHATGGVNPSTGGKATGGTSSPSPTGGKATGGAATGGSSTVAPAGGSGDGGAPTGGQSNAGGKSALGGSTSAGGQPTGGKSTAGGTSTVGGQATGGSTSAGGAAQSSGCGKAPTIASSQYNNGTTIAITAGGMQRRYILNVPTNYDNAKPYKLVVAYHALNSNDKSVYSEKYYGLLPLSNNTTIFVAPNGEQNGAGCTGTGTGESGCGWPNTSDHDMQLADAVVAQVEQNFCIDTNRIFATGWSYGASMSEQTACERPLGGTGSWGVRAIAIYAVAYLSNSTNCKASKPVAYYASHGTHDSVLSYDGNSATGDGGGVGIAKTWAAVDGCTWQLPTKVTSGAHVCTKLSGCTAGYPLEFCSFNGDHTAYPDNGNESTSWGPQEVWTFLSQF